MRNNKDKTAIDESVLEEDAPNINEPQVDDSPDNVDPNPDPPTPPVMETEIVSDEEKGESKADRDATEPDEVKETLPKTSKETDDQKEQRYKAQQTEAQIQAARAKLFIDKIDEASKIPDPTVEELTVFVAQDGMKWEDLTPFEQAQTKRLYKSEKQTTLFTQVARSAKEVDEWAGKVDTFIDTTDGKPEFLELSGHEAEFRKFAMKEAHRGVAIDSLLLPAFLKNLPKTPQKRGSLFQTGGGGEKESTPGKITDADQAAALRNNDPREYKRQLKAGKISVEI